ncbi:MAG TPA: NADH-quinone oxidoreductase subunit NuoB [Kiritimatiellia bacterium]|jgi:Ni,Fe-hydrogenase III small subunit/Pyruvate/2-oxoacid:ferredoxin oxidoreductase delta subunit|nr:NADH-quinone oxidoreductase subunit NuoB [Kiritimatiellia bacterium]HOE37790.1 NADH-quinone oxidoreductase subunit NuoB [Kiritimatiellia bacterium]HOR73277.1 NADH-quinone oxidoreductase subunit NuoB [Kiritimatiellia bacterium]HOU57842.1 NADH-quinone oxidoreductase subunit NuoB [Kiritimatiellia bacterium]HQK43366.1 NADH-quinone oxidoreductase subunit NuoB [Kiritimatiellia bacterium]
MNRLILERWRQKHRTVAYPAQPPALPDRLRGAPELNPDKCRADCTQCVAACPTGAITRVNGVLQLDMGRCLFCGDCQAACPTGAIRLTHDHRMAVRRREDLVVTGRERPLAVALDAKIKSLFGRSLKLRQVSAGGCNACEADTNVLTTVVFDLSRFGIRFVASPRHADGLLITGPATENMALALQKTYDALAEPRLVIAVGACAISGGPFAGHAEVRNGATALLPVDLFIPGCPPHPITILDGLLRLLGRLEDI